MNKKVGLILSALVLSSFLIGVVSAAGLTQVISDAINGVIDLVNPFLQSLLGETSGGDVFFGKLLIIVIVISLVYVVLSKSMISFFQDRAWLLWIVSVAVGLLGVRFLTSDMINTIILPNSTLAVALTAGIPFVVYFLLVKDFSPVIYQRMAWIFFAVIFFALYTLRYDELGNVKWIYPLTGILSLIMAAICGIFLKLRAKIIGEKAVNAAKLVGARAIQRQITDTTNAYNAAPSGYLGGLIDPVNASKTTEHGTDAYLKDLKFLKEKLEQHIA